MINAIWITAGAQTTVAPFALKSCVQAEEIGLAVTKLPRSRNCVELVKVLHTCHPSGHTCSEGGAVWAAMIWFRAGQRQDIHDTAQALDAVNLSMIQEALSLQVEHPQATSA